VGGLSAIALRDDPALGWLALDDLFVRQNTFLYCLDWGERVFVFVDVSSRKDVLAEPFLDRGIRKWAQGDAFVVSFDSAIAYSKAIETTELVDSVTWIWNTGRCGSTLLHRIFANAGQVSRSPLASISEPRWLDELANWASPGLKIDEGMASDICLAAHVLEFSHLRSLAVMAGQEPPRLFSMNPKAFGHKIIRLVERAFPKKVQNHVFNYRDAPLVIESFGSIFNAGETTWQYYLRRAKASLLPGGQGVQPPGAPLPVFSSIAMKEQGSSLAKTLAHLASHPVVPMLTLTWCDAVLTWLEFADGFYAEIEGSDRPISVHMSELVSHSTREAVVTSLLADAGLEPTPAVIQAALACFEEHSQKGSEVWRQSSAQTGRVFLLLSDKAAIDAAVGSIERLKLLGGPSLRLPGIVAK
jgi:hypothetical protein